MLAEDTNGKGSVRGRFECKVPGMCGQYDTITALAQFSFRIEVCEASFEGFDGVLLAGPELERGLNSHVGDAVVVPTRVGSARTKCRAFVFPRWGAGREDWLSITVDGLSQPLF